MGEYTTKYDKLVIHNNTWYTITKAMRKVHKDLDY